MSRYEKGLNSDFSPDSGRAMILVIRIGLYEEKILGMISPKSRSTKVTTTILIKNSHPVASPKSISESISPLAKTTMHTLTRLLAISMVASRYFSDESSVRIVLLDRSLLFLNRSMSCGVSEKKAVSDADTIADTNNNKTTNDRITPSWRENVLNVTDEIYK